MKKSLFLYGLILIMMANITSAQSLYSIDNKRTIKFYEEGRNAYASGNIEEAEEMLFKALDREPGFIEAMLLLGDLYHSQEDWNKELKILTRALNTDSTFFIPTYYNAGMAAYNAGNYDIALQNFGKYLKLSDNENALKRARKMIERVTFVKETVENPYDIELVSAGEGVNSELHEYWPSITADEQTMVITVLRPRDPLLFKEKGDELPRNSVFFQEDFYMSHADSAGQWQDRHLLMGQLNTDSNEGAQTLSADGNWMFFTGCGRSDSKGSCDIYFSAKTNYGWTAPVNVGAPVNTPLWESQPQFSADGRTLFFISSRGGGEGGKDIWKATLAGITDDGVPFFGDLENLGEQVNTSGDENSPFLHHDGKTLYFSSNGHMGMGGMDLFMSRKDSFGNWTEPINLGYPINTEKDEIGLVVTAKGNKAYFSTDGQQDTRGAKDIYSFTLPDDFRPEPALYVKGKVFDAETGEVLAADFDLKSLENGETIITSKGSSFTGEFLVSLPSGGEYAFKADHPGYLFYSGNFNLSGNHPVDRPYYLDIGLKPIEAGATVRLENVFFETDSYQLDPRSKVELQEVVEFMKENPNIRIMLEGHTDNVGSEEYNLDLSENRARSVFNYLAANGVDEARMEYKGYGFSRPIDTNETEEGRAQNRRTEMRIL
ncbi:WD40 repeat protein [Marinilabilia salmonicolor]|jgi:flagellar motor protein MotB|uniref:OmpA family protein n=1 Tax=Marinilabilia salmonicolor TaxID=989 RepID=UPI000D0808F3|nr:OmpA family protein [Marinilabilia salmonicolor]PRZ01054.1 WD40 repeat protein [Marinilabilia salmonicolor]